MKFQINKAIDEIINLTIVGNPNFNYQVPYKTIKFYEFDNKTIYSVIAGELKKGKCEDKTYKFQFTNSIIPIEFSEIVLKMKLPDFYAFCQKGTDNSFIDCKIPNQSDYCLVLDDSIDILVDSIEPENMEIDSNISLYFHGFANKGTLEINPQNITNKYIDGNYFYFVMKYKKSFDENISETLTFNMDISEMNGNGIISSSCFLDNEYINCSVTKENLKNGNNS